MWTIVFSAVVGAHVYMGVYPTEEICTQELRSHVKDKAKTFECKFVEGLTAPVVAENSTNSTRQSYKSYPNTHEASLIVNPRLNPFNKPRVYMTQQ